MANNKYLTTVTLSFILLVNSFIYGQYEKKDFRWPDGKRAAISLSFDDARPSQIDNGIPILDKYDVKATFYVLTKHLERRLADWRKVVANGHEIGNHSINRVRVIFHGHVKMLWKIIHSL